MRDPPGGSLNVEPLKKPTRFSMIWLEPPRTGVRWHEPHPSALKIGPRPSATPSGPVNSSAAVSKLHSAAGIVGELGEFTSDAWLAQNSCAKPFDAPVNPVNASVTPDCVSVVAGATTARASSTTPSDARNRKDKTLRIAHLLPEPNFDWEYLRA